MRARQALPCQSPARLGDLVPPPDSRAETAPALASKRISASRAAPTVLPEFAVRCLMLNLRIARA
eukprot:1157029-Prymnesium_polylepis.1